MALFLEIGLILVLIPWSRFWERNYFGDLMPFVRVVMTNNYLRGAVSGLGLVNIWLALAELAEVMTKPGAEPAGHLHED